VVDADVPLPEPAAGEVRVRVAAAGLTPTELTWDETYRWPDGSPRLPTIPGHDVSGTVDGLGSGVTEWAVGDAVYGLVDFPRHGSAAEFVTLPADAVARRPASLDAVTAAAVPLSALTAWQALFDHGRVGAGDAVLIHGAAGGVGAYAVQMARRAGARVFATASAGHAPSVRALGADTVIDYTATPFETVATGVAMVLDTMGGDVRARSWATLRPGGHLVALNAPVPAGSIPRSDVSGTFFIVHPSRPQLDEITRLIDAGQLRPAVEAVYPLADARAAFERAVAGHLRGKVVLSVATP
jgi:NADPH:quinone reductase-like Zn-dependent oxidoreductase